MHKTERTKRFFKKKNADETVCTHLLVVAELTAVQLSILL